MNRITQTIGRYTTYIVIKQGNLRTQREITYLYGATR